MIKVTLFLCIVFFNTHAIAQYEFNQWHNGLETPETHPDLQKWENTLTFGQYKGQQIDSELYVHAKPVSKDSLAKLTTEMKRQKLRTDVEYFAVDEVNHEGQWYLAAIPKKTSKLYYLTQYFGPKIPYFMPEGLFAHAALNFNFADDYPVLLVPKNSAAEPVMIHDLVMSADGARPKGAPFSPFSGILKTYLLVTNFKSAITMAKKTTTKILAYELDVTPELINQKLRGALRMSLTDAYEHRYHTFAKRDGGNCQTAALCIVDLEGEEQNLAPVTRTLFENVKMLPTFVYRGVMNARKWAAENIPGARIVRPAEFFPSLSGSALKCRNVNKNVQDMTELKNINQALSKP